MNVVRLVLLVAAAICFLLAGLNVQARYNLVAFGLLCVALAMLPLWVATP